MVPRCIEAADCVLHHGYNTHKTTLQISSEVLHSMEQRLPVLYF